MKAIQIQKNGGPEVMGLTELPIPEAGEDQALVKVKAAGVNFIDVYQRSGLYPVKLPYTLGLEGSGIVEKIGSAVETLRVGDRVAWQGRSGGYAEYAAVPADKLVKLPEGIDFPQAAAAMLQGMTAHYLAVDTYPIKKGDTVLIHAAAGGVGRLLVQIAKRRGAQVLATVSTEQKAELARKAGADELILYTQTDFVEEVKRLTGGTGVNAVYDSVGQTTFLKSLECLSRRGILVSFGQSSGKIDPIEPAILGAKGSLYLTRPSLFHYVADRQSLERRASEVLGWIARGKLVLHIGEKLPLAEAAEAHRRLEARKTVGKVLLIP
ncbi:MAG: quinone oxidoreductase [Spirochaetaceae bacterium]|nr:MAG: quinone oxidoreductase [Spirochaetaceae bacterium]